jgi:hypothetical protein
MGIKGRERGLICVRGMTQLWPEKAHLSPVGSVGNSHKPLDCIRELAARPRAVLRYEPWSVQPVIPKAGRSESTVGKVMAPSDASSIRCTCRSGLKVPEG